MSTDQQEHRRLSSCSMRIRMSWSMRRGASARIWRAGFRRWRREAEIREALEKAFDYRGDITVTRQGWNGG